MIVVADTHVHLYRCCDPVSALSHAARNLLRHVATDSPCVYILALTEPRGQCFFDRIRSGDIALAGCVVEPLDDACAIRVTGLATPLILIAGRQITTAENLEVLALATNRTISDGLALDDTLREVSASDGIPVLPWSPGKWTFRRARLVRDVIACSSGASLFIGDSSLRPRSWPEPRLMSMARARGLRVIAGSDALPFAGEERWIGRYAIVARGEFDLTRPSSAFRRLMSSSETCMVATGTRRSLGRVMSSVARLFVKSGPRRLSRVFRNGRSSPRS